MSEGKPTDILVAEDEPAHAEALRRTLHDCEGQVIVRLAGSLREYREAVVARRPDIALLDLNLPDGSAQEILTSPPEDGPFPIVVMTSYGNERIAVKAMKAGALDYVVKSPEAFAGMSRTLERALREWELLRERKQTHAQRELLIADLQAAMAKVRMLSGFLPICANCKKIRDDSGYWNQIESYIRDHSEAEFSHGICPECRQLLFPGTPGK
jgi:DNA-binding NtrC family response regulator